MFPYSEEEPAPNSVVEEYLQEKRKYEDKRKQQPKKGVSREDQVIVWKTREKDSRKSSENYYFFTCVKMKIKNPMFLFL